MLNKQNSLYCTIRERIIAADADPELYLHDSLEVVIFGSVAAGLEREDSDIDVLCVGGFEGRLKTNQLDLLAISESKSQDRRWQQSELAGHIYIYGYWLQGNSRRKHFTGFSKECIEAKKRRVAAFARRLPGAWDELNSDFRMKYLTKVRRETQRLLRIESNEAVPPTRILDDSSSSEERFAVCERLRSLAGREHPDFRESFIEGMLREWGKDLTD